MPSSGTWASSAREEPEDDNAFGNDAETPEDGASKPSKAGDKPASAPGAGVPADMETAEASTALDAVDAGALRRFADSAAGDVELIRSAATAVRGRRFRAAGCWAAGSFAAVVPAVRGPRLRAAGFWLTAAVSSVIVPMSFVAADGLTVDATRDARVVEELDVTVRGGGTDDDEEEEDDDEVATGARRKLGKLITDTVMAEVGLLVMPHSHARRRRSWYAFLAASRFSRIELYLMSAASARLARFAWRFTSR